MRSAASGRKRPRPRSVLAGARSSDRCKDRSHGCSLARGSNEPQTKRAGFLFAIPPAAPILTSRVSGPHGGAGRRPPVPTGESHETA